MSGRVKILLVEDDPWLAELEVKTLENAGFEVTHAPHAPSAIVKLDEVKPDVMILDVLLTGSTAFALLHEMQSYDDSGALPIILCTNMAESIDLEDVKSYGVRRIVDKSTMVPADLIAAVKAVLS
ncbi:MAG: response regulator BaeR [Candidatus Saccharibacteria bacterium]|nr:response regulator BaeR [Candidatus Saccharibacteria bacterium]